MLGRRQRQEERLYWEGFRDALVTGRPNPTQFESGSSIADQPRYPQGFEDGKRAAKRIHRDALVSEVSRLSLTPGDKIVVKLGRSLDKGAVDEIASTLKPHFPDNEILVCGEDCELSTVEQHPLRPVSA